MRKYNIKHCLPAIVLLFMLFMLPTVAFAAGDVFDTIQAKMISTVKDLRKIAYVIAGFGLIMFTFLAIFNKISFKHLGYIMISLSLLSLMMPFINYFSGANLQDNELNYDDFIGGGDASIEGSNVTSIDDCAATNTCPEDVEVPQMPQIPGVPEMPPIAGLPQGVEVMPENAAGLAGLPDLEEIVTAEEEKKSLKEKLQGAIEGAQKLVDNVHNTIDTVQDVKTAVETAVAGAQTVKEVLQGDGNVIDKLAGVSGAIGSTSTSVASSLGSAAREGGSVAEYLGANDVSDYLQGAAEKNRDRADNITEWTNMGADIRDISTDVERAGKRITGQ